MQRVPLATKSLRDSFHSRFFMRLTISFAIRRMPSATRMVSRI